MSGSAPSMTIQVSSNTVSYSRPKFYPVKRFFSVIVAGNGCSCPFTTPLAGHCHRSRDLDWWYNPSPLATSVSQLRPRGRRHFSYIISIVFVLSIIQYLTKFSAHSFPPFFHFAYPSSIGLCVFYSNYIQVQGSAGLVRVSPLTNHRRSMRAATHGEWMTGTRGSLTRWFCVCPVAMCAGIFYVPVLLLICLFFIRSCFGFSFTTSSLS